MLMIAKDIEFVTTDSVWENMAVTSLTANGSLLILKLRIGSVT
jgi:hypothetical protein